MSLNCKVVCKRSRSHTTTGQSRVRDSLWCASRAGPQARLASIIASRDSAYHCDKVSSVIDTRVRDASAQPYRERFIPHETMHGNAATAHFASRARLPGPSCEQRNIFSPRTFCQVARHFPLLPSLAAVCRALSAHRPYILALDVAPGFLRSAASGLTSLSAQGAGSRAASNAPPCASHPPYIPPPNTPLLLLLLLAGSSRACSVLSIRRWRRERPLSSSPHRKGTRRASRRFSALTARAAT